MDHKFPKSVNGWQRLLASPFDTLVVKVNPYMLLNTNVDLNKLHFKLVKLCIINKTTECINKRKRVEMEDTNFIDSDEYSIELEISTLNNVKKIKYYIAR